MTDFDRVAARKRCEAATARGLYDSGQAYLSPTELREIAMVMGTDLAAALDELDAMEKRLAECVHLADELVAYAAKRDEQIARLREVLESVARYEYIPLWARQMARQALTDDATQGTNG